MGAEAFTDCLREADSPLIRTLRRSEYFLNFSSVIVGFIRID
jgi:hypothetical protein